MQVFKANPYMSGIYNVHVSSICMQIFCIVRSVLKTLKVLITQNRDTLQPIRVLIPRYFADETSSSWQLRRRYMYISTCKCLTCLKKVLINIEKL